MSSPMFISWTNDLIESKGRSLDRSEAPSATTYVLHQLRADIVAGHFAPGEKLPLKILVDRYKTSVAPIREALAALCGTGLAVSQSQRGFRVAEVSSEDFALVAEMRKRLELLALKISIERASPIWVEEARRAFKELTTISQKVGQDGPITVEWEFLHRQFHFTLIANCGSPSLLNICAQLNDRYDRYRRLAIRSKSYMAGVAVDNEEIVGAAVAGNVDLATALLERHIDAMTEVILEAGRTHPL
jgi:GntR family carbon starvation induced transcriptional regulator